MRRIFRSLVPSQVRDFARPYTLPFKIIRTSDKYDALTFEIIARLGKSANCIDCGAYRGTVLDVIVQKAPKGQHIGFEPLPEQAACLERHFRWFRNVTVIPKAVSDKVGKTTFHHNVSQPAYSGIRRRGYDHADPVVSLITVSMTRIDDEVAADRNISFIKLDIEGGEYDALVGASQTLRRCHPIVVFEMGPRGIGVYGRAGVDMIDLFASHQMSVVPMDPSSNGPVTRAEMSERWGKPGWHYYFCAYPQGTERPF